MAQPARKIYDEEQKDSNSKGDSSAPKGARDFYAVKGEGKGDGVPRGNLKAVRDGESLQESPQESDQTKEEKNPEDSFYKSKAKKPSRFRGSSKSKNARKKGATYGGIGAGVTALVFFFSTFLSGPLQFLAVSNSILGSFAALDEFSGSRIGRLSRFMKYDGSANERRRLGVVSNRIADKYTARLAADGIIIDTNPAGNMVGVTVDGEYRDFRNFSGFQNQQIRKEWRDILKSKGYSKLSTSMVSRPIFVRHGVNLRFLGNIRKIPGETYYSFKQKIKEGFRDYLKGISFEASTFGRQIADLEERIAILESQPNPDQGEIDRLNDILDQMRNSVGESDEVIDQIRQAYDDAIRGGATQAEATRAAGQNLARGVGGVGIIGAVVGIGVCFAQNLGEQAVALELDQRYLPSLRLGLEAVSVADQIKSGEDIDLEELSILAERFDSEYGSWAAAQNIKAENGEEGGVPAPQHTKVGDVENSFVVQVSEIFSWGPLPAFCDLMANVIVQGVLIALELIACFFTGGLACAAIAVGGEIAEEAISQLILSPFGASILLSLLGEEISEETSGPDYGNVAAQGTHFAANEAFREYGGLSITQEEEVALDNYIDEREREYFAKQSIYEKYINPNNPDSMVGSTRLTLQNSSFASFNPFSSLSSAFKIFGAVNAQEENTTSYDHISKVAYTVDEMESELTLDPFENERYLYQEYGSVEAMEAEFEECFRYLPGEGEEVEPGYYRAPNLCSGRSQQFQEDLYRYRVYKFDHAAILGLGCYSGDQQSCSDLGIDVSTEITGVSAGGSIVGDPYTDSTSVLCAEGTIDLDIHTAYVGGEPVQMRLCGLPNIEQNRHESNSASPYYIDGASGKAIVNSRMSGAWYALAEAARAEGITLSAISSFRTMEHQEALCNNNAACRSGSYTAVARPGNSSHQAAVAIDFAQMWGASAQSGATCSNKQTHPSDAYQWLEANANSFGIKQYAAESWHWDALDASNRC